MVYWQINCHVKFLKNYIIVASELKMGLLYGNYIHCTYICSQPCLTFKKVTFYLHVATTLEL
jgi:hypothetical protein